MGLTPTRAQTQDTGQFKTTEFTLLMMANVGDNNNKFYSCELQSDGCRWQIFTHYGRAGASGVMEIRQARSESEARCEYSRLLSEKQKKGYHKVEVTEPTVGSDGIRGKAAPTRGGNRPASISHLSDNPKVQALLSILYAENLHSIQTLSAVTVSQSGGLSTPLGPVTLDQIRRARHCLLNRDSNGFYSLIPHRFGHRVPETALLTNGDTFTRERPVGSDGSRRGCSPTVG